MPADKEYLERFYDKCADSPKGVLSKDEFLANVEDFFAKQSFTKAFVTISNPQDSAPTPDDLKRYNEEKAKPENAICGWDNILPELLKGIGEELARENHPSTPEHVASQIRGKFDALGKLLSAEMGRPKKQRRISEEELDGIVAALFSERKGFYGGLSLPGAISDIRCGLVQKGIQEYIEGIGIAKPPNWENGWLYIPQPDDEGWDYEPLFADFLLYEEDRRRGTWHIDWEPFHEINYEMFAGKKFNPNMWDFKFYRIAEILKKIKFTRNIMLIFSCDGKCRVIQFDPQERTFVSKSGKVVKIPLSTHQIIVTPYQKMAKHVLGRDGIGYFNMMCKRVKPNLAQKRLRRIRKFERGITTSRLSPQGVIFGAQLGFINCSICFGHLMAWMVQVGLLKMGQYVTKADYFSGPPLFADHLQLAVKNMGSHLVARIRWLDPTFVPSPRGARQFLLCGLKVRTSSSVKLPTWKHAAPYHISNIFLAFEVPTSGAIEFPFLGPDMPLYDEEFYKLWQSGQVPSIEVYTQLYALQQNWSDFAIVPASQASSMPHKTVFLGTPPQMPKVTSLEF